MANDNPRRCFGNCGTVFVNDADAHLCLMTEDCVAYLGAFCRPCLIAHWYAAHDYDPQAAGLH